MDDLGLYLKVQNFLFAESRMLDEGKFEDWLELFSEDVRYRIPSRQTHEAFGEGISQDGWIYLVDDDKGFLRARVQRLRTGFAHAEEPASRTRHFVSNIEIDDNSAADTSADDTTAEGAMDVRSNIMVFQSRLEKTERFYVGRRVDRLVQKGESFLITDRLIVFDHVVLPRSLSVLF